MAGQHIFFTKHASKEILSFTASQSFNMHVGRLISTIAKNTCHVMDDQHAANAIQYESMKILTWTYIQIWSLGFIIKKPIRWQQANYKHMCILIIYIFCHINLCQQLQVKQYDNLYLKASICFDGYLGSDLFGGASDNLCYSCKRQKPKAPPNGLNCPTICYLQLRWKLDVSSFLRMSTRIISMLGTQAQLQCLCLTFQF